MEHRGLDVYHPTTGEIRGSSTDEIACWFIDSDYNMKEINHYGDVVPKVYECMTTMQGPL